MSDKLDIVGIQVNGDVCCLHFRLKLEAEETEEDEEEQDEEGDRA